MAEWKKVIVSGSVASLAAVSASTGIDVDGRIAATSFYGDGSNLTNVPAGSINIESFADGTGITVNAGVDKLILSDAGTEKQILVSQLFDSSDFDTEVAANSAVTANTAKTSNVSTNLSKTTATGQITINSSDGDNVVIGEATDSIAGLMSVTHHDKLDGIEAGAKADQSASDIRTLLGTGNGNLVPAAGGSGTFLKGDGTFGTPSYTTNTNTQLSNAQVKAAVEAATDSNTFTDADHSKLNGIEASATADQTNAEITAAVEASALDMGSNNITTTGKVLYSNMYSTEGDLPSASTYHGMFAHVHGTGAGYFAHGGNWIKLANNSQLPSVGDGGLTTNDFTNADHTKLNGIEASADVTDTTNVASAGAVMDSEVAALALIKTLTATTISGSVTSLSSSIATGVATNTAKVGVTTGTVTSAGALMDSELTSRANVIAINQSLVSGATPTFTTTNFTDASNKRLMTDAQETKLDSVESNSTADQTAIEIINLLNSDLGGDKQIGNQSSDLMTFGGSVTVTGDLTVSGTTTTVDTANLAVKDQFIELNDGGSAADAGLFVGGATSAFGWDNSEGRWAFDKTGAAADQTSITADAYASAVVVTDDANYRKNGNIRVQSNEIYIYVE